MFSMKHMYQKVFNNMKETQYLCNLKQHTTIKLCKFQVDDIIFNRTMNTFKIRNLRPFIITKIISNVFISVKDLENEVEQSLNINIYNALLVPKLQKHLALQQHKKQLN